jgi:LPXTG-site transpeptidase (sortase) family protein
MLTRLRSFDLKGFWLIIPGVILLFIGAAGAFNLFQAVQQQDELSYEAIPRDMIETGYTAFGDGTTPEAGFIPLDIPSDSTPAFELPTMSAPTGIAVEGVLATEIPNIPTFLPDEQSVLPTLEGATPEPVVPKWLYIPSLSVMAPIVPAEHHEVLVVDSDGNELPFDQWDAPDEYAAGWHTTSASLGQPGNTVLIGHHNVFGKVFGTLAYLQEGDMIFVYGAGHWYIYEVTNKMVLPERNVSLEQRLANAAWIMPSDDERLTLVTCWPETNNTHRLIIVAKPVAVR